MDIKDFEILVDLYKYKNMTKVANIHYLSQPAITKRIKRIENKLNCQLIFSNNKGIIFTNFGEKIISYSYQVLQIYDSLKMSINQMQGLVGGSINILSSPNYCRYRLPSAIEVFAEKYPSVHLNIMVEKNTNILPRLLKENNLMGIVHYKQNWDGESILLFTEPMCLIYSHKNANLSLSDYNFIAHDLDAFNVRQIGRWASENSILLNTNKLHVGDLKSCKELVERGLGWSIVPRICLDDFNGEIHNLYFKDNTPFIRETHLLFHNAYYKLQQVELFINILKENEKLYKYFS